MRKEKLPVKIEAHWMVIPSGYSYSFLRKKKETANDISNKRNFLFFQGTQLWSMKELKLCWKDEISIPLEV